MLFGRALTFERFQKIQQIKSTLTAVSLWYLVGVSASWTEHNVETVITLKKLLRPLKHAKDLQAYWARRKMLRTKSEAMNAATASRYNLSLISRRGVVLLGFASEQCATPALALDHAPD